MTKTRQKLDLKNREKDVTVQYETHAVTGNGNYVSAAETLLKLARKNREIDWSNLSLY